MHMKMRAVHVKLILVLLLNSATVGIAWYAYNQAEGVAVSADQVKDHNERIFRLTVMYPRSEFIRARVVKPLKFIFWIQLGQAVVLLMPANWPLSQGENEEKIAAHTSQPATARAV